MADAPVDPSSGPTASTGQPSLNQRWTRQETLVLIEGKRTVEGRRLAGPGRGRLWEPISAYCKSRGVNRGPKNCQNRWRLINEDYKKIQEWERGDKIVPFWEMDTYLRRDKKLPPSFHREVYDLLDGGEMEVEEKEREEEREGEERVFDSGKNKGLFEDEEEGQEREGDSVDVPSASPVTAAVPISGRTGIINNLPSSDGEFLSTSPLGGRTVILPLIDLGGGPHCRMEDRDHLVGQILDAVRSFGFFQVVNHGVSELVMSDMMGVTDEFFDMSEDDRIPYFNEYTTDSSSRSSFASSGNDKLGNWPRTLSLACYPIQETIKDWPDKPTRLRKALEKFILETKDVSVMLLSLICEALGLKEIEGEFRSGHVLMNAHHYLPSLEPELVFPLLARRDPNVIEVLLQGGFSSLQVMHQDGWARVEPIATNALLVNLGKNLEIFRNDPLGSVEHQAITNLGALGTCIAVFSMPAVECFTKPGKEMVEEENPSLDESLVPKHFRICTDVPTKRVDVMAFFRKND